MAIKSQSKAIDSHRKPLQPLIVISGPAMSHCNNEPLNAISEPLGVNSWASWLLEGIEEHEWPILWAHVRWAAAPP